MAKSGFLEQPFARWLDRRIPPQSALTFTQKHIFILPSRQGWYFSLVLLLLLLTAINYQNNLAYALVFFLASIINTAIVMTYLNLAGLQLRAGKVYPAFAGDHAEFELQLMREPRKQHHFLHIGWPGNVMQQHDLVEEEKKTVRLHCETVKRGPFRPGRLLLESFYPLGFLRCWSWVDLDFATVTYPKPWPLAELPGQVSAGGSGREKPHAGTDDFWGFKDYNKGDPLRHVDWRSLAKGQQLQSKVYSDREDEKHWVDWYALPREGTEQRLSKMCSWVLLLDQADKRYGLRLPEAEIEPDRGDKHRHRVLSALAMHGYEPGAENG